MERRKSFRYPSSPARRPAELLVGGKSCAAILLDESTGGFRVSIESCDVPCETDQEIRLKTYSGWHDTKIVRLLSHPENVELGMMRLRDDLNIESSSPRKVSRNQFHRPGSGIPGKEYLVGLAIILVVPLLPSLFQGIVSTEDTVQVAEASSEMDIPSLADMNEKPGSEGIVGTIFRSGIHGSPSKSRSGGGGSDKTAAKNIARGARTVGRATDQMIASGTNGARHVLKSTSLLVHKLLTGLPSAHQGRLEEVVDEYSENPTGANLKEIETLLEEPQFDSLQQLVSRGQVSSGELASLLYAEFHL